MAESKCPLPTQDIKTNLANRQKAIDVAHYGPANPKEPNDAYWTAKAKIFGGSVKEAKTMRCGNCAGFNQTTKLIGCITKGIGMDAQEVEKAGDLGYCEIFDFKCASLRTCDAWIVGGPITDKTNFEQLKADLIALKEQGATLLYDPSQERDESGKWTSTGGAFKNKLIEKAQKQNPALDMAKSSVKGSIKGVTAIANGAKMATQYGASKAYQIKNWLASDNGQKFLHGVARTISIGSQGGIEAIKSAHGDRYKILIGTLFNPQVGAIVAGQSALRGFVKGAVAEYRKVEGGRQVSNIVRKGVGIRPMSAQGDVVMLDRDPDMNDVADYIADAIAVAIREEIEGKKIFEIATFAYDPNQERDASGKWTSGGGGAGGEILVSPNIKENMNYEEAKKMTDSPEHARAVSIARDAIKKQDMDGKIESGVGDWEDGAENSIKIDVKGVKDFDQLKYTASKLGASLNQKAVVAFQKKKDGPDILHKISADRPMDDVRKILSENGISFRTMVGDRAKTSVTILDQGSQLTANVAKFLGAINGKSEAVRGVGEFIGGDTRIAGKKAYKGIIDNYERSFPNRIHLGLQRGGGRNYYRSYQAIDFYDPNQQRDESGKWTGGGAIAQGATPTPRWAQENPAEASKRTGEATTLYHGTSADVLKNIRKDGLKPSKSGVWGGGKVYSTDSLDLAMEYGVLRSGASPKIGGKQLIGIISVLADGFKSVADNIPTTKAQKMGKTGLAAVSKIFTKDGAVSPSAIKKMQIFEVDSIRKYVYENGPKPSPLATKELADGQKLIYVPIVIELPDDGSEGFQFDEAVAIESFVFQYNGERIEFYNPDQPRDEKGRWAGGGGSGGGAKGKTKGKSSKGTKESKTSTTSDEIDAEIERLKADPKVKIAMEKMSKLQKEVAKAEGSEDASVTHWSLRDPKRYIQKKDIIDTFENPTPEHRAWKEAVIASELNPKAKSDNPIAVILMGSPASGKTTTGRPFAEKILNGKETTKIDPDSVKSKSKGFEGWNAGAFHEESALISEKIVFPRAVMDNHNLLIDITGKNSNKVAEMARTLKSVGYKIGLVHVDVDDKVALNRASKRFSKPNGRYVPYDYVKGSAEKARQTWNKLTSEGIADIGYSIDGNADRSKGTAPVKATHGNLFD
jgi:adenylate kinase family enzyme